MPLFPRIVACAFAVLLPGAVQAQGYTPYDTYHDAFGGPHYSGNLTPAPDDRTVLGPEIAAGDPWLIRTRPARGWGEISDIDAGFWEYQADRIRQRHQDVEELDFRRRQEDARQRGDLSGLTVTGAPLIPLPAEGGIYGPRY